MINLLQINLNNDTINIKVQHFALVFIQIHCFKTIQKIYNRVYKE